MSSPRRCIDSTCLEAAIPGLSRCRRHMGSTGWAKYVRDHPKRSATYRDSTYRRNRAIVLKRDPWCRLRLPGCTGRSTTADHVISVAKGGTNDLGNLRGSCGNCNQLRGGAEGRATAKRRAAQRNHRGMESR
jgi:hypothetical protein